MNSVIHPSGPEPENTYWLRRGIFVVAFLLALGLIWWVLSGLFGGDDRSTVAATPQNPSSLASAEATPSPSASPSASASASPSASASASSTPSASASQTPSQSPTPTPTPSAPAECQGGDVSLSLDGSRSPKIGAGAAYTITMKSEKGCTLDLAKTPVQLAVTSGSDRIWTTVHCPAWAPKGKADLTGGKSFAAKVNWQGKRSHDGCKLDAQVLRPGTYRVSATMDGAEPDTMVVMPKA